MYSGGAVPVTIGESDGRNVGAAVTGLVNGKILVVYHRGKSSSEGLGVCQMSPGDGAHWVGCTGWGAQSGVYNVVYIGGLSQ